MAQANSYGRKPHVAGAGRPVHCQPAFPIESDLGKFNDFAMYCGDQQRKSQIISN
jgi:hypothetical protein